MTTMSYVVITEQNLDECFNLRKKNLIKILDINKGLFQPTAIEAIIAAKNNNNIRSQKNDLILLQGFRQFYQGRMAFTLNKIVGKIPYYNLNKQITKLLALGVYHQGDEHGFQSDV